MAPIKKGFLFAQLTANEIIFSGSINYSKFKPGAFFGEKCSYLLKLLELKVKHAFAVEY